MENLTKRNITNRILLKKLDDYGIQYDKRINDIIKLINLDIEDIHIVDSSGRSVIFITPINVFQFYRNKDVFNNIVSFIEVHKNTNDYIVKYLEHFEELNTILWEKVEPLHYHNVLDIQQNIKDIKRDIKEAINYIHEIGYLHGDCTIDNIGKNKRGRYVLFDFDLISNIYEKENRDFYIFNRSVKFLNERCK